MISHKTKEGKTVKRLGPIEGWSSDSRLICSLLYSTVDLKSLPIGRPGEGLRSFSSSKMDDGRWGAVNTNILRLDRVSSPTDEMSARYVLSQPEELKRPVKIIRETIDNFRSVKKWIQVYENKHTIVCAIRDKPPVAGLKLIADQLRQGTIVPAEEHVYVAPNYVWGNRSEISEDPDNLPRVLPDTIEDAINAAKKLR